MDVAALRQALASFLGDERYRKFVKHLSYGQRMRYWQEEAWGQFVSGHPEWAMGEDELRVALRVCWVHGAELLTETLTVVDAVADSRTGVTWYCPDCRQAYTSAHPAVKRSIDWSRLGDKVTGT